MLIANGMIPASAWLSLAALLFAARIGGGLARRLRQPPVTGEVAVGIVIGNLDLLGWDVGPPWIGLPLEFLAELGLVLLLFQAGLDSSLAQMRKVVGRAGRVAGIGVVVPIALGAGLMELWMPETSMKHHLFVGAALAATSVGITVRVLGDVGASDRDETRILVGAAVIDDVIGLVLLSVLLAMGETSAGGLVWDTVQIIAAALGFLIASVTVGRSVVPRVLGATLRPQTRVETGLVAFGLCLAYAGLSALAGLAAIVGAYAAGLVLEDAHVKRIGGTVEDVADFARPLTAFLAPAFFVYVGLSVDLSLFSSSVLSLCLALTAVAILGKLVAGAGAGKSVDRTVVGLGMIPRGEVGLVFANAGVAIIVDGRPIVDPPTYAAIVVMVLLTTIVGPALLSRRIERQKNGVLPGRPSHTEATEGSRTPQ